MKQILFLAFIVITTLSNAQQFHENLSFAKYEKWINSTKIPEYKFYAVEKEGEAEYNETVKYKATFIKGQTDRLSINLESKGSFSSFSSTAKQKDGGIEFESNGYKMAYVPLNAKYPSAFLAIEMPKINACLVLHFVPLKSKEEALKLLTNIDLSKLSAQ